MKCFIVKEQARSHQKFNRKRKASYYAKLRDAFTKYHPNRNLLNDDLYGVVYYFYKVNVNVDSDNISKPIWDALKSFLYDDDQQIKMRISGSLDINSPWFQTLDVTNLPSNILTDLLDALENENHIIYIECGSLNTNLYKFNLE